ncbi:MAG: GNAT family protein [Chloroflexota bacterium]
MLGNELLRGEQVYLARPTPEDIPVIAGWSQDTEYYRMLRRGFSYPETSESYSGWFASMVSEQSGFPFAIRRQDDEGLIGWLVLREIFWQARHCAFAIGLDPAQRGRGYGTDATRVALSYAFLELNLNRVGLDVMAYNEAGIRAYTKVGFVHEGTLRALTYRDGIYYDALMMSMLRSDWEKRYNQPAISYPAAAQASAPATDAAPE